MRLNRRIAAVMVTAAMAGAAAFAMPAAETGAVDILVPVAQEPVQVELSKINLKTNQTASFNLPEYEKKLSYMYTSMDTQIVKVDGMGNLTPGLSDETGETSVLVKVLYDFEEVGSYSVEMKTMDVQGERIVADKDGQELSAVARPEVTYKLVDKASEVASVALEGRQVKLQTYKAGERSFTLEGYAGQIQFNVITGTILVSSDGQKNPLPSDDAHASETPASKAPSDSGAPASKAPSDSGAPASKAPSDSEAPASETPKALAGDVDGNNKVDLADAQTVLQVALKIVSLDKPEALKAADIDHNNRVDLADAQYILKKALKIIE